MKKCPHCGAPIEEGTQFCGFCGNPVGSAKPDLSDKVNQTINDFQNTPDYSGGFDPYDVQQNKTISLLSYLGILFLIPLLARPQSKYARFHVNQGIVLFITNIIIGILRGILNAIAGDSVLSLPVSLISAAAGILVLVLMVMGIVNAVGGKAKELPLIGGIRILHD